MLTTEILEKSIIVIAHPDDEVLWFSSILDKVDEVIFCYLDVKSNPQWTLGRKQSLSEYTMKNISSIGLNESEVFNDNNWKNPIITGYGVKISKEGLSGKKYIENYYKLKEELEKRLVGSQNVFTHNPWGEYGNEEHIQVYRVIKELQEELKFNLWFPNYCSNKSFRLMLKYISEFNTEFVTRETNKKLSNNIKDLYKKNGCWTWYDDWKWFNDESFIKDGTCQEKNEKYGRVFPLNMINVEINNESTEKSNRISVIANKTLKKIFGR